MLMYEMTLKSSIMVPCKLILNSLLTIRVVSVSNSVRNNDQVTTKSTKHCYSYNLFQSREVNGTQKLLQFLLDTLESKLINLF